MRCVLILLVLASSFAFGQGIQLTSTQQQMLDSLPEAQRQEALAAIRDLQGQQGLSEQQSINEPVSQQSSTVPVAMAPQTVVQSEIRAAGRSRIILNLRLSGSLSDAQRSELAADPVAQRLTGTHLHILDDSGVLTLPGLEPIPVLGMVVADINRRLMAEPYLSIFDVDSWILGQTLTGVEALAPFGYNLFESSGATLNAPTSGPVPPDYVLGPGDSVRVQLFGNVNGIYEYEVSRDGILNLPDIGPVIVAGLRFSEVRADVNLRVKEMLIGTQVSVTMGQLRTIRVFILGDVNEPGSYVVGGLATISGALHSSGGISRIGSLRDIQLKRDGTVVSKLDAYDLLLRGDNSGDSRLQQGDVIFVPPIGTTVSVGGAVNRPAIYEVKRLTSAADLVGLAGGLKPAAHAAGARLARIEADGERTVLSVDVQSESVSTVRIRNGDTLIIPEVLPEVHNAVVLGGHVHRPGTYPWRSGMRLTDLIGSSQELKSAADTRYVLIRREKQRGQPIEVLSANLAAALLAPSSAANIRLEASDTVHVFSLALGRQRVVEPLLEELRLQSTIDAPVRVAQISGNVRAPGEYPLETDMRVSDLIRAGGDLTEAAYTLRAELTRYSIGDGKSRETEVVKVDLNAIRRGVDSADLVLREHDYLIINRTPEWDAIWTVSLKGEVQFPGEYRVRRGETLANVINRAGGFTEAAYVEGAVFLRESLRVQEQQQIENLAGRLESDLATLSLETIANGGAETFSTGRLLLDQLRSTEAVGRLVVDLRQDGGATESAETIEMRDGDQLLVPIRSQVVTVLGETQQNTSHLFSGNLSREDYINLSGGLTRRADKKLIYVVRANGAVVAGSRSRWFGRRDNVRIWPGDTIVVPLKTDRIRPLTFWGSVTQVLYQGAIAVAAIKTFDD